MLARHRIQFRHILSASLLAALAVLLLLACGQRQPLPGQTITQRERRVIYWCRTREDRRAPLETPLDTGAMICVLLVDDQQAVRRGLRLRLHLEPDMQVVGEAGSGKEALRLAQTLAPDVVLMDVELPEMDGIETTATLQMMVPLSAVVMLSIHDDVQTRTRAQAAGAVAFVVKGDTTDQLIATIRQVAGRAGRSRGER